MSTMAKPLARLIVMLLLVAGTAATVTQANADPSYPASITTTTSLTVSATTQWGIGARATARVSSDSGTPTGSVKLAVNGTVQATVALINGVASWRTPARAGVGRHTLQATYVPSNGSSFNANSASKSYTVVKAKTRTTASTPDIRKGAHPTAKATITSPNRLEPAGYVVFRLFEGTTWLASKKVVVRSGTATVRFGNVLRKAGTYTVKALYSGNHRYQKSSGADTLVVR